MYSRNEEVVVCRGFSEGRSVMYGVFQYLGSHVDSISFYVGLG